MNPHFKRDYPDDWRMPSRVYARLDHVELPSASVSGKMLLAFDSVDAQWLVDRARVDERFDLDKPDFALVAQAARPLQASGPGLGPSLFETVPLYRIEVEHQLGLTLFDYGHPDFVDTGRQDSGLAALEDIWFILDLFLEGMGNASPALVYPGLFAQPRSAFVTGTALQGTMPSVQRGRALSGIFSLANLPVLATSSLQHVLSVGVADLLAVYDVGQGNSNALLEEHLGRPAPRLYYDLGAGVYRNKHTTPAVLQFCFTNRPPIVLSHWDADHWAGAFANSFGGTYPALQQNWYAPMQKVGPVHVAFAHQLISSGGTMHTYTAVPGTIGICGLATNRTLRFTLGSGTDRNNTGFVLAVEDNTLQPRRSWLLTGDCDYVYFMGHLNPNPPVGLVAPHHGADLVGGMNAPAPVVLQNSYCRLMYSFGAGNKHGKKRHPTAKGMQLHAASGWHHGAWSPATPGDCVAGNDVLATEMHGFGAGSGAQLGGCLIGWNQVPSPISPPCAASAPSCTVSPIQS